MTFAAYVFSSEENVLNAEIVFVSLTLFNILRAAMLTLPGGMAYLERVSLNSPVRVVPFFVAE